MGDIIKPHYRAIILIFASNNNNIYINCRKIWKTYMNLDPTIKVYFVYGQLQVNDILYDFDEKSDFIFSDINEQDFPFVIEKTIKAMQLIHENVSYDYFIRTNLSTFWDFNKLHLQLNELPTKNCYSGDGPLPGYKSSGYYLSGTDTIVTPDMISSIINNKHLIDYNSVEDAAMGKYFNGILGAPMLPNRICFFEDINSINEIDKIQNRIIDAINNNKNHYRVKTLYGNREEIDFCIYKQLLLNIYNINL